MAVVVWHQGVRAAAYIQDGSGFTIGCGAAVVGVWVFIEICESTSLPFSD